MNMKEFKAIDIQDYVNKPKEEILQAVKAGMKLLNPKINTLLRYGAETGRISADAYNFAMSSGGLFNLLRDTPFIRNGEYDYNKTRNELLKELGRELQFARMKTSTLTGARDEYKRRSQIVKDVYDPEFLKGLSADEIKQLVSDTWDDFHRFNERHLNYSSSQLLQIFTTKGRNNMEMEKAIENLEQKQQQEQETQINEAMRNTGFKPLWEV